MDKIIFFVDTLNKIQCGVSSSTDIYIYKHDITITMFLLFRP